MSGPVAKKSNMGGKRPGAGRPKGSGVRVRMPLEMLEELGPCPEDPLLVANWYRRLINVLQHGVLSGEPWVTFLRDARISATTVMKLVPEEVKALVADLLQRERDEMKDDSGGAVTVERKADHVERAVSLRRNPN